MAAWDRQPGETAKAFAAFCTYRDMGFKRSLRLAYRSHTGRIQGKDASGTWILWSKRNDWSGRIAEYDAEMDRRARTKAEEEAVARRTAMLRRHQEAGELLARRGIEHFVKNPVERTHDAISAVKTGVDLERQAEGLPTWIVTIMTEDVDVLDQRLGALVAGAAPGVCGDAGGEEAEVPQLALAAVASRNGRG